MCLSMFCSFRSVYIPKEGEVYARYMHVRVREQDSLPNSPPIHPLLSGRDEVDAFPSAKEMGGMFSRICGGTHEGHHPGNPVSCFNFYASRSNPRSYGPPIPNSLEYPFSKSCLPGKAPILEHVKVLLCDQDSLTSGGTFLPFVDQTLLRCSHQRQVSSTTSPKVTSLVYGRSSTEEVKAFLAAFNSVVAANKEPPAGFLPNTLYSFDVERVSTRPATPFKVVVGDDEQNPKLCYAKASMPARVHLGFHEERFEIIFPWEHGVISSTYHGDYVLRVPATPLPDLWHGLFGKLQGFGIGIGLSQDVTALSEFVCAYYTFSSASGPIRLRTLDLSVLLALAGYNSPKTCISVLNFTFTGGVVQKDWRIRCGLGRWASTDPLPKALSLYLQSEAIGVLNTAHIALVVVLLHWFVTPGIAAVVSKKEPAKFLGWFWRFMVAVLEGASLPSQASFAAGVDRVADPRALISEVCYSEDHPPTFSVEELASFIPPWRNVTGGGCPSDQMAFDHIAATLWPALKRKEVPSHLRWESTLHVFASFLVGRAPPAASPGVMPGAGCGVDRGAIDIPELMISTTPPSASVRAVYRRYKATLPESHPLRRLTLPQVVLLYVWRHPEQAIMLFRRSSINCASPPFLEEYPLIRPLITALCGGLDDLPVPDFYQRLVEARRVRQDIRSVDFLQNAVGRIVSGEKRKLLTSLAGARKRLKRRGVALPPPPPIPATRGPPVWVAAEAPETSHAGEEVVRPSVRVSSAAADEVGEVSVQEAGMSAPVASVNPPERRRVRFRSPSPAGSLGPDVLLVETPDWDDL